MHILYNHTDTLTVMQQTLYFNQTFIKKVFILIQEVLLTKNTLPASTSANYLDLLYKSFTTNTCFCRAAKKSRSNRTRFHRQTFQILSRETRK
jgi:hypothetical protein